MKITSYFTLLLIIFFQNGVKATDYYWVSGTGEWTDLSHWAITSGGNVLHQELPGVDDRVYFDANSFLGLNDSVIIPQNYPAECGGMYWLPGTGNAGIYYFSFFGGVVELTIHGDFIVQPTVKFVSLLHPELNMKVECKGMIGNSYRVLPNDYFVKLTLTFSDGGTWVFEEDPILHIVYAKANTQIDFRNRVVSLNWLRTELGSRIILTNATLNIGDIGELATINIPVYTSNSGFLEYQFNTVEEEDFLNARIFTFAPYNVVTIGRPGVLVDSVHLQASIVTNDFTITSLRGVLIDKVEMRASGNIGGLDAAIDSLTIHSGVFVQVGPRVNTFSAPLAVNHLIAEGSCQYPIYLKGGGDNPSARHLRSANDQVLSNVILQGLQIDYLASDPERAGSWRAENSFDFGDNLNVDIVPTPSGRTLYRLAGSNEWYDPAYWSLSSNGPGGVCTPLPNDNVVFDDYSFVAGVADTLTTVTRVEIQSLPFFCRDITFNFSDLVNFQPVISHADLRISGSWVFQPHLNYDVDKTHIWGAEEHTLRSAGVKIKNLYQQGLGSYFLEDALEGAYNTELRFMRGNFYSEAQTITFGRIDLQGRNGNTDSITLAGSSVNLLGFEDTGSPSLFNMDCSPDFDLSRNRYFDLSETRLFNHLDGGIFCLLSRDFNCDLISADTSISTTLIQENFQAFNPIGFRTIDLQGNSELLGNISVDTLRLQPGTQHTLRGLRQLNIERWLDARGTACRPIRFQPREEDVSNRPKMAIAATAAIRADYLELDRVEATGVQSFIGANSNVVDAGNSPDPTLGWELAYQPGAPPFSLSPGFLGPDTSFCAPGPNARLLPDSVLAPSVLNYDYRWSDGGTDDQLLPDDPGDYTLALSFIDATGERCTLSDTITVRLLSFEPTPWFPAYEVIDARCFADASGEIIVFPNDSIGSYTLNGNAPGRADDFTALLPGTYLLTVIGPVGCPADDSITVAAPPPIATNLPAVISRLHPEPGSHTLVVNGGQPPYTFTWNPVSTTVFLSDLSCVDCPNPEFTPARTGTFQLMIEDANGCIYEAETLLATDYLRGVYLPNAFSPDNNGINDYLNIFGPPENFSVLEVSIYDRWGNQWFATEEMFSNVPSSGWNGLANDGRPAPAGTYIFTAIIRWPDGTERQLKESVHLIR